MALALPSGIAVYIPKNEITAPGTRSHHKQLLALDAKSSLIESKSHNNK